MTPSAVPYEHRKHANQINNSENTKYHSVFSFFNPTQSSRVILHFFRWNQKEFLYSIFTLVLKICPKPHLPPFSTVVVFEFG